MASPLVPVWSLEEEIVIAGFVLLTFVKIVGEYVVEKVGNDDGVFVGVIVMFSSPNEKNGEDTRHFRDSNLRHSPSQPSLLFVAFAQVGPDDDSLKI
mmetsp:Transcript_39302/g.44817  ORF Transcript_39302/g.44817 Transcript_39302/m.44817 type:complete len:97 (-) Transcript_39302:196-486(-)